MQLGPQIDRDAPQPPSALRRAIVPVLVVVALGAGALFDYQRQLFKQEVTTTEVATLGRHHGDGYAAGYVIPQITSKREAARLGREGPLQGWRHR